MPQKPRASRTLTHPLRRRFGLPRLSGLILLGLSIAATGQTPSSPVRVLHNFQIEESEPSNPGLIKASDGRLYGTWFQQETAFDLGGVFRIEADGTYTVVYVFPNSNNGSEGNGPWGTLAEGRDHNVYGATVFGGAYEVGTIYRVSPEGVFTPLHSFGANPLDGTYPNGGLILGSDGNFYGTTSAGGNDNVGTIFRMTPQGEVTTLHSFGLNQIPTGGARPVSNLTEGRDGWLYGVTGFNEDSINDYGTVFRISKKGQFRVIHRFFPPDGFSPVAALMQAKDGTFYGTTYYGGSESNAGGTIFRMTPGGKVSFLHMFYSINQDGSPVWGSNPFNSLMEAEDGFLYSTIMICGPDQLDCAYRISSCGKFEVLHIFTPQEGMGENGLIQGNDGLLYGDAQGGGIDNGIRANGTAFSFKPPDSDTALDKDQAVPTPPDPQ